MPTATAPKTEVRTGEARKDESQLMLALRELLEAAAKSMGISAKDREKRAELLAKQKTDAKPVELKINSFDKSYGDNTFDGAAKSKTLQEMRAFEKPVSSRAVNVFVVRTTGHVAISAVAHRDRLMLIA
jgi:hypothetical protein